MSDILNNIYLSLYTYINKSLSNFNYIYINKIIIDNNLKNFFLIEDTTSSTASTASIVFKKDLL
jgi:hypothetical protein